MHKSQMIHKIMSAGKFSITYVCFLFQYYAREFIFDTLVWIFLKYCRHVRPSATELSMPIPCANDDYGVFWLHQIKLIHSS